MCFYFLLSRDLNFLALIINMIKPIVKNVYWLITIQLNLVYGYCFT